MNHSFDVDIAMKYGVNAAILLQSIGWWIKKNKANNRHYYDGYYWTYNSRAAFVELFPYLSERQIKTAIDKLILDGIIITGDYNTDKWKRPTWYALTEKGWALYQNVPNDDTEMSNRGNKTVPSYTVISTVIDDDEERAREEANPYGDEDIRFPIGTVQQYASDNIKILGYRAMMELNSFVEDLGEAVVRHAIDNMMDNGVDTWSYVKKILNDYADEGIKTVGAAKAFDEKFKKGKNKQNVEVKHEHKRLNYFNSPEEYAQNEREADEILREMRIKEGLVKHDGAHRIGTQRTGGDATVADGGGQGM